ncbi:MAG: hypothetical protein MOGMAGMI_01624 [Candidatus Omnitrophica bacterium]|nr:hypothetical protein [Candidatus Omnitrophota bacterium]
MRRSWIVWVLMVWVLSTAGTAQATIEQGKVYKAAFGDKPKCVHCHVDEKPKKEGDHELNAYGLKVKTAAGEAEPTEEHYKAVGPS